MVSAHFIKIQVDVEIEPDEGGFHAWCPAFKGLHVCGETESETLAAVEDAINAYIQSLLKHGDPLPVGCDITELRPKFVERVKGLFPRRHHGRRVTTEVACPA